MLSCTHPEHVGGRVLPLDNFPIKRTQYKPDGTRRHSSWHGRQPWCRRCSARVHRRYRQRPEVKRAERLRKRLARLEKRYGIEHTRVRRERIRRNGETT